MRVAAAAALVAVVLAAAAVLALVTTVVVVLVAMLAVLALAALVATVVIVLVAVLAMHGLARVRAHGAAALRLLCGELPARCVCQGRLLRRAAGVLAAVTCARCRGARFAGGGLRMRRGLRLAARRVLRGGLPANAALRAGDLRLAADRVLLAGLRGSYAVLAARHGLLLAGVTTDGGLSARDLGQAAGRVLLAGLGRGRGVLTGHRGLLLARLLLLLLLSRRRELLARYRGRLLAMLLLACHRRRLLTGRLGRLHSHAAFARKQWEHPLHALMLSCRFNNCTTAHQHSRARAFKARQKLCTKTRWLDREPWHVAAVAVRGVCAV